MVDCAKWLTCAALLGFFAAFRTLLPSACRHVRQPSLEALTAIATNERATPSLVYRSLLKSIHDGRLVPGAKLPNERDLARQLNTSRTAVRSALAMMERQGLVRRRVGSGTFLTDDADRVFEQDGSDQRRQPQLVPSFLEIVEGRLLFEPAMMHLVVSRVEPDEIEEMRATLGEILSAPTWREFKESIYALHQKMFAATKNRFLDADHRQHRRRPPRRASSTAATPTGPRPRPVRQQTHKELAAIVDAIAARQGEQGRSS